MRVGFWRASRQGRRAPRWTALLGAALAASVASRPATAERASGDTAAEKREAAGSGGSGKGVRWRDEWPRVRWWEVTGTAALMGAAFWLRFAGPAPPDNWRGGILFDDWLLDRVRIESPRTAAGFELTTEILFYGGMAYRFVDSVGVPLVGYGDLDLAFQLSMIDLSAFSLQAIVLWGSQTLVGRTRPLALRCERDGLTQERCRIPIRLGAQRSFIAGHPATSVTVAGLTCLHHAHIPLYGEPGDALACVATLAAAGVNGVFRVVGEQHYPSDLLFGVALGAVSGWALPAALHYGFDPPSRSARARALGAGATVLPYADGRAFGLLSVGRF